MFSSLRPHGLQPTRLLHPWDFPGMNTGVGCHFLLALVEILICSIFKMMWFLDVKALFMVQVGFTIGFTKKVHTLRASLVAPWTGRYAHQQDWKTEGLDHLGNSFEW